MARRAEQIELNRSSCAEVYARDLVPLRVHGATTELTLAGGTSSSNHLRSTSESGANGDGGMRSPSSSRGNGWTISLRPFAEPNCTIRLIHYPPQPNQEDNEFGFAPHTDNNFITFLAQSRLPGLEVRTAEVAYTP